MLEKVLERLGTTESTTLAIKREEGGKIRVTSLLWPEPKVILWGEVFEIRNVDGRLHIAASGTTTTNGTRRSRPMTPTDRTTASSRTVNLAAQST